MLRRVAVIAMVLLVGSSLIALGKPLLSWSIGTGIQRRYPNTCTGQTTVFESTDAAVYVQVEVDGPIERSHIVRWKWYAPDGSLFFTSTDTTQCPKPGYHWNEYTLWCSLNIAGTPAATKPGRWHVKVYWGARRLRTQYFEIRSSGPPPLIFDPFSSGPSPLIFGPSTQQSISVAYTDGVAYCSARIRKAGSTAAPTLVRFEVDTGAGITMVSRDLADALGITLRSGEKRTLVDVSGTEINAWAHWMEITLLGDNNTVLSPIRVTVAFADSEDVPYLLGRKDVLDQVRILFKQDGFTISIKE